MRLYNSLSRTVERLRMRPGSPVSLYVCGITPYDTTHLGHAFTYVVFDVLARHIEVVHQRPVRYVQNVTDIDDDILRKADETGQDWRSLAAEWTLRFRTDMERLNVAPPDAFPAATAFIAPMLTMASNLVAARLAYVEAGSVYFDARAGLADVPILGEIEPEALLAIANARGNDPADPNKRDPMDPVLWQAARAGEPAWDSPWGPGRPGWHVECAAMAAELLGVPVDIHGGGADLAFPHHTFEAALAEAATGVRPFTRVWAHVAMVEKDGEKMSKSLGNLVLVRDLMETHHPDTLRLYLLRHGYRRPWTWDADELAATTAWTRTLHGAMERSAGRGPGLDPAPYGPRFTAALDNDLDTPAAIQVVLALADDILAAGAGVDVVPAQDILRLLAGRVLGLRLGPEPPLEGGWPQFRPGVAP